MVEFIVHWWAFVTINIKWSLQKARNVRLTNDYCLVGCVTPQNVWRSGTAVLAKKGGGNCANFR